VFTLTTVSKRVVGKVGDDQALTLADLRRGQPDPCVVVHQRKHFVGEIPQRAVNRCCS
jgi:hypothetical protein